MLTLFTIPKPFRGHIAVIQRNAIRSWTLLRPKPEIVLFGDDEGTAEAAGEFGVRHVPEIARNEHGTPLVNDLFEKARHRADHDLLCYVNADIILMSDFMQAVGRVARRRARFLLVGQRWDVDVNNRLDFGGENWEVGFKEHVWRQGMLHPQTGIDYFVFPRDLFGTVPPFAIGRTAWDNWLIYRARACRVPVIDATPVLVAVHQNHDYVHCPGGEAGMSKGEEAERNLELAGGRRNIFTLEDATYILTPGGLRRGLDRKRLRRYLHSLPVLVPCLRLPVKALRKAKQAGRMLTER